MKLTNAIRLSAIFALSSLLIISMPSCGTDDENDEPEMPDTPSVDDPQNANIKIGTSYYAELSEENPVASHHLHYTVYDNYNFVLTFKSSTRCEITMSGTNWNYSLAGDTYREQHIPATTKSTGYTINGSRIYIDDFDPEYHLAKGLCWSGTITGYGSIIHNGNDDIVFTPGN